MPGHGLQARGIAREQKMIYAGMTLFLEQGYERTTTAQIARKAGMSPASFFAAFENKEALLLRLTQIMFRSQFSRAEKMLRDLYVTAYSLPSTSDFINRSMTPRLRQIFSRWMKRADDSELFELELASAGVTRSYMSVPCDMYFTMERKIRRYLSCCFRIYCVPEKEYAPYVERVLQTDLHQVAENIGPECRSGLRCDHGSSCGRKLSQKNPAGVADSGRISLYEGLIQNVATSFFAGSAGVTRMAVRMGPVPR